MTEEREMTAPMTSVGAEVGQSPDLTPIITKAVETGATKLLDHFKSQYGSLYFIPL